MRSWERELLDWHPGSAADQAAGLRRLFRARPARAVAFVSGREACGRTKLLVHTAAALADAGESVVIVDENSGPDNVHRVFGLKARHDLLDLVQRDLPMQRLVQPVAARLSVLSAAGFVAAVPHVDAATATRLNAAFRQLQEGSSYVLIDCAAGQGQHLSPLALAAPQMAVVVAAHGTAITTAYALVKRLAQERGREGFQVAITRAASDREALSIFHNMSRTAHDHLGVRLDYLGSARVPGVDHLADALQASLSRSSGDWFGFLPAARGKALASTAGNRISSQP